MEYWKLALVGGAAFWGVRTLWMLMDDHRQQTLARLMNEEVARRRAAAESVSPVETDANQQAA